MYVCMYLDKIEAELAFINKQTWISGPGRQQRVDYGTLGWESI